MLLPDSLVAAPVPVDSVRLLDGELESRPLGPQPIRGFDQPVELHELVLESQRSAAAPLAKRRDLSPLVGRERPVSAQVGGYGLWLANEVCDLVQIRCYATGSAVRLHKRID